MDEVLRSRARRAYERGRLVRALPWMAWPALIASFAAIGGIASVPIAIAAFVVLAILVVHAQHRGGAIGRASVLGLIAGTFAFALAFGALRLCDASCPDDPRATLGACTVVGLFSGAIVGVLIGRARQMRAILGGAIVAAMCGALGCAHGGSSAVLGLLAGTALVSVPWIVWSATRKSA